MLKENSRSTRHSTCNGWHWRWTVDGVAGRYVAVCEANVPENSAIVHCKTSISFRMTSNGVLLSFTIPWTVCAFLLRRWLRGFIDATTWLTYLVITWFRRRSNCSRGVAMTSGLRPDCLCQQKLCTTSVRYGHIHIPLSYAAMKRVVPFRLF